MTTKITVDNNEFIVLEDNTYKCLCGAIRKDINKLSAHLKTKSHYTNLQWRRINGNTVVFTSLLKPDLKIYR